MTTKWLARLIACLLALLTGNATPASAYSMPTTANVPSGYAYDALAVARVDVHEFGAVVASPSLFSDVHEGSGSSPAAAQGASTTPVRQSVATNTVDDFVDLASPARRTHILDGDATGGGHLWPGNPGKTPFPQGWSGDRIMHEISDIATDPVAWQNAASQGSRTVLTGTRGGVDIRVIVNTKTGEIISGYPTNLPINP